MTLVSSSGCALVFPKAALKILMLRLLPPPPPPDPRDSDFNGMRITGRYWNFGEAAKVIPMVNQGLESTLSHRALTPWCGKSTHVGVRRSDF